MVKSWKEFKNNLKTIGTIFSFKFTLSLFAAMLLTIVLAIASMAAMDFTLEKAGNLWDFAVEKADDFKGDATPPAGDVLVDEAESANLLYQNLGIMEKDYFRGLEEVYRAQTGKKTLSMFSEHNVMEGVLRNTVNYGIYDDVTVETVVNKDGKIHSCWITYTGASPEGLTLFYELIEANVTLFQPNLSEGEHEALVNRIHLHTIRTEKERINAVQGNMQFLISYTNYNMTFIVKHKDDN